MCFLGVLFHYSQHTLSQTLEGRSKALNLALLLPELQRKTHLAHSQEQLTQTLIAIKHSFLQLFWIVKSQQSIIELVTRPLIDARQEQLESMLATAGREHGRMTRALIQRLDAFQSDEPAGAGSNTKNPLSSGSECGLSNSSLPSSENSHNMFGKIHLLSELLAEQTRDLKASVVSSSRPNGDLVSPQMISTCKELRREMLTLLRRSQTSPENLTRSSESMSSDRVASTTKAKRYSRKSKKSSSSAALMENPSESDDVSSVQTRASHTRSGHYLNFFCFLFVKNH